jgi:hypothetical protein
MCLWPSTTPGSVSTSRSRSVSFCFCAKLRTWAWANLMSSRSRFFIVPMARSISCGVSLNEAGAQLSNFCDSSRTATSLRASMSARMCSTVSRTLASAALIALASIPRLRCLATTLLPCILSSSAQADDPVFTSALIYSRRRDNWVPRRSLSSGRPLRAGPVGGHDNIT